MVTNTRILAAGFSRMAPNVHRSRLVAFTAILLTALAHSAVCAEALFVPGRILVKPKSGISETNFVQKLSLRNISHTRTLPQQNIRVLSVAEEQADSLIASLRKDPDIEFAERDYLAKAAFVPNDPYVSSGSEWHLAKIQAPEAWNLNTGSTNTVIAILDSGINPAHPDLQGQTLSGYDFVNNSNAPIDDFGHGTAVAGVIVAAGNNGLGVVGVAYGARVLPVKVMDSSGFASYSCIAEGIKYAVDQGARVINLSMGGSSASSTLQDAVNYAWSNNVLVVAAAGNTANNTPQYPAACDHVVGVSATEPDDTLATFSSYGDDVMLSAPGDTIWTTQRDLNNPYGSWRGTSFSSPIVAGVAALMISQNPSLSNSRIVALLQQTADDAGPTGYDPSFGYGRVNASQALIAASLEPGGPGANPNPPVEVVAGDNIPPVIAIQHAPANRSRLSSPEISLSGTADDASGIARVEVRVNGQPPVFAQGTADWSAQVMLSPGNNVLQVRAVSRAGEISEPFTGTYTYVVMMPVVVQTTGLGTVTPRLNGRLLEIGKVYTVRALPGPGQAFGGWTGTGTGSPVLQFTMTSNLVVEANFVPSPFPPVKGNYAGLVANTNGVSPINSGSFRLAVTDSGLFTGKVFVEGAGYGFRGSFDLAGNASAQTHGADQQLGLQLHVDLTNGSEQVTGSVSAPDWISALSGDRNIYNANTNPAAQSGKHGFILVEAEQPAQTAANGISFIFASGRALVRGRLEDGRPFSTASLLAKNGDCPFCLSLGRGSEIVIGWLNFPVSPVPSAAGTVLWVRTGTNAFAATLRATALP